MYVVEKCSSGRENDMNEKEIEKAFVKQVREKGGIAFKFVSPGMSGVPDRIVVMPGGQIGFVEVKAPGKKPRPEQVFQMSRLRGLGFPVMVLDGTDQIPGMIETIQKAGEGN